jgi:hypothetical protein
VGDAHSIRSPQSNSYPIDPSPNCVTLMLFGDFIILDRT